MRDIDVVVYSRDERRLSRLFEDRGYVPDPAIVHSREFGMKRLIYHDPPLAGTWASGAAAAVAAVLVGTTAPLVLALYAVAYRQPLGWASVLVGIVVGCAAGVSRWRVQLAVAGAVLSGLVLALLVAVTGGFPEKLASADGYVPAALLLALLAVTATATVGAVTPELAERGAIPAVLGSIVAALVWGGNAALVAVYVREREDRSSVVGGVYEMTSAAAVIMLAAVVIAGIGVARWAAQLRAQ